MGLVRNQSIKNSVSFYIGMLIGAINTIFVYPYTFIDSPEHLGLLQIILAYSIVISAFTTLGAPKMFLRFFPAIKNKGQLYFLSFLTPFIGFLFSLIVYIFFKEKILAAINASQLLEDNFFYVILLIFFIGFYEILTSISRSFLNAATPVFINEVFLKLYSLSVLFLHWIGYIDFTVFLKIYVSGYILKFLILFLIQYSKQRISFSISFSSLNLREMFRYSFYVLIGSTAVMLVARVDMMILGSLLKGDYGLKQVAFYSIAFYIGNSIMVPAKSIIAISVPLIADAWEKNNLSKIQSIYYKSAINQLIVGSVFFLCIWINIDDIFNMLPKEYKAGKWVVFFIGIAQLFNISTGVNGAIITNSKYYRFDLYTSILLLVITVATNLFLIPENNPFSKFGVQGIIGASIATASSIFLFNIVRLFLIKIKMNMHPFSLKTIYAIFGFLLIYIFLDISFSLIPVFHLPFINIVFKSSIVLLISAIFVLYCNLSDDINKFVIDLRKRYFNL